MKKFILSLLAAATIAGPMVSGAAEAAPFQQRHTTIVRHDGRRTVVTERDVYRRDGYRNGNHEAYRNGNRQGYRNWRRGDRFDYRQANNYQRLDNWQAYRGRRLYAPPRGYHWVRSGNDAVLVAVTGGLIGAVLAGAFN